jgi:hypothetical protein
MKPVGNGPELQAACCRVCHAGALFLKKHLQAPFRLANEHGKAIVLSEVSDYRSIDN